MNGIHYVIRNQEGQVWSQSRNAFVDKTAEGIHSKFDSWMLAMEKTTCINSDFCAVEPVEDYIYNVNDLESLGVYLARSGKKAFTVTVNEAGKKTVHDKLSLSDTFGVVYLCLANHGFQTTHTSRLGHILNIDFSDDDITSYIEIA